MSRNTRRRKLDNYDELCRRFSDNINQLLNSGKGKKITNKQLSVITAASQDSVGKWLVGKSLPSTNQLYIIADYLGVSIDWLFDKNLKGITELRYTTYYEAFNTFRKMIFCELLDVSAVKDPFLSFLIKESITIDNSSVPSNKVSIWYKKVELDYDVPIFDRDFINRYYNYASESFDDITEYDRYLARLKGLIAWNDYLSSPDVGSFEGYDMQYEFQEWAQKYLDDLNANTF